MSSGAGPVERGHELDGTRVRRVVLAGLLLALSCAGSLALSRGVQRRLTPRRAVAPEAVVPAPDFSHARDWVRRADARARRDAAILELDSYGWVDRQAGVIHVPVQRAAELLLKEGLRVGGVAEEGR